MPENNNTGANDRRTFLDGTLNMLAIPGSRLCTLKGKLAYIIPVDENPAFYATLKNKNGKPACYMDVRVREKANPDEQGNTHIIALSVSKRNRERFNLDKKEDLYAATPVIGNFREINPSPRQNAPAVEDMPENIAGSPLDSEFTDW